MLADPRADTLVTDFAEQWLQLRLINAKAPDQRTFPTFDDNLRRDMLRETELFLRSVLLEDASVLDLLGADYTFLNERLAEHYGVDGVFGDAFRRVARAGSESPRPLGAGQHPVPDLRRDAHVARVPRQVDPDELLQLAAAAAARGRAGARSQHRGQHAAQRARAPRAASQGSRLRRLSRDHRSDGARAREFRCDRPLARHGCGAADRRECDAAGRHCHLGPERLARSAAPPPRALRVDVHGEAHGVRARAPPRGRGHADRAPHRARSRERRLPVQRARARHRAQPAVSAEGPLRRRAQRRRSRTLADASRRQGSRTNVHHEETSFASHRAARCGRRRDRLAVSRRHGARRERRAAGAAAVRRSLRAERHSAGDLHAAAVGQARAAAAARAVRAAARAHQRRDGLASARSVRSPRHRLACG